MGVKMEKVKISTEYITLQQLLKLKSVINSGGEVKYFLTTTKVLVNEELETRRGRKLYPNDVVKVLGKEFVIQ